MCTFVGSDDELTALVQFISYKDFGDGPAQVRGIVDLWYVVLVAAVQPSAKAVAIDSCNMSVSTRIPTA